MGSREPIEPPLEPPLLSFLGLAYDNNKGTDWYSLHISKPDQCLPLLRLPILERIINYLNLSWIISRTCGQTWWYNLILHITSHFF